MSPYTVCVILLSPDIHIKKVPSLMHKKILHMHTRSRRHSCSCFRSLSVMKKQAGQARLCRGKMTHSPTHCWGSFSKASSRPSSIYRLKRPMSWEGPGCPNLLWVTLHHVCTGYCQELMRNDKRLFRLLHHSFFLNLLHNFSLHAYSWCPGWCRSECLWIEWLLYDHI